MSLQAQLDLILVNFKLLTYININIFRGEKDLWQLAAEVTKDKENSEMGNTEASILIAGSKSAVSGIDSYMLNDT